MDYENPIDRIIQRFQHRWETDRQYRAAMSGVFGILLIVVLCTGVGLLDVTATNVLAAVGFQMPGSSNPSSSQQNTDTGVVVGGLRQFPTETIPSWPGQVTPPSSPIASSGTPQPSPTPTATPTDAATSGPCTSNCGGGGQPAGHISASWSPLTWASGQTGASFTVHATDNNGNPKAGVGIAIIYTWAGSKTWLDEPPNLGGTTDASGNYTSTGSHLQVGNCLSGGDKAYVQAHFPGNSNLVTNTWLVPCQ